MTPPNFLTKKTNENELSVICERFKINHEQLQQTATHGKTLYLGYNSKSMNKHYYGTKPKYEDT